ncbi:hemicentin-2-like [Arapaima gigas]
MQRTPAWHLLLQVTGLLASHILIQQPPHVQVLQGEPALLSCSFNHSLGNSPPFYKWFQADTELKVSSNVTQTLIPDNNSSHIRILMFFPSVQLHQADKYTCEVYILWNLQKDYGKGPGTLLEVHAPPSVSTMPTEQEVELKGRKLTLTCTASSYYPKGINITWLYPDNKTVTNGVTSTLEQYTPRQGFRMISYLVLHPRATDQQIQYSCQVVHSTLRLPITRDISFTLRRGLSYQQVSRRSSPLGHFSPLSGQHVGAPVGSFLELLCVVDGPHPSHVLWLDPSGTVRADGPLSRATLTLSLLQPSDSGPYTCVASDLYRRHVLEVHVEALSPTSLWARWVTFPLFLLTVASMHIWSRCCPGARGRQPGRSGRRQGFADAGGK